MKKKIKGVILAIVILSITVLSGCASSDDMAKFHFTAGYSFRECQQEKINGNPCGLSLEKEMEIKEEWLREDAIQAFEHEDFLLDGEATKLK